MSVLQNSPLRKVEIEYASLPHELQSIWDEIGETEANREKMLLEIQQECLEVYRRKINQANHARDQLRQTIANSKTALTDICSTMQERPEIRQLDQKPGNLKEELGRILSQLEEMQKRKAERIKQFLDVIKQIQRIESEINGTYEDAASKSPVNESDLSMGKLEELHRELFVLQEKKCDRLKQIKDDLNTLNSLCLVLGMNFRETVGELDPSLINSEGSRTISNNTIKRLCSSIEKLRKVKIQRMQKLQDLAATLLELWNLMDTPIEEQQEFLSITSNIAASEHEKTEPDCLSEALLKRVEAEVSRLEEMKSSKMKEIVLKKKSQLEEIRKKTHLAMESDGSVEHGIEAIESGDIEPASVLEHVEAEIARVKEEAFSRKEILEKVEKWRAMCEEESWLEEYNMDENRYNAGRGTHLNFKRAEKARVIVNKLPGTVEALTCKVTAWENEKGTEFLYDGVRLLSMLEDYTISRQEKEQARRRQRDLKRLQGQQMAEQEVIYGAKMSPSKLQGAKKGAKTSNSVASPKKISAGGGTMLQSSRPRSPQSTKSPSQSRPGKRLDQALQNVPPQSPES